MKLTIKDTIDIFVDMVTDIFADQELSRKAALSRSYSLEKFVKNILQMHKFDAEELMMNKLKEDGCSV